MVRYKWNFFHTARLAYLPAAPSVILILSVDYGNHPRMQTGWTSLIPHVRRVIGVSSLFFPSAIEAKFIVYGKRHHNPLHAWHPHCLCNHFSKYVTVYPSVQDSWQGTTACCRSPSPARSTPSSSLTHCRRSWQIGKFCYGTPLFGDIWWGLLKIASLLKDTVKLGYISSKTPQALF